MKENTLKKGMSLILPDADSADPNYAVDYDTAVDAHLEEERSRMTASDLARIRLREKNALGSAKSLAERARIEENIAEAEALGESPAAREYLAGGDSDMSPYAGTTRRDVVKLLSSLNVNTSLYLTRTDTYNLLSCLLTCNEEQLDAVYSNPKTPLAVKTVIKRLQEDSRTGNIETLERLWDRVFGKGVAAADLQLPEAATAAPGLIPKTLVSREAYVLIRETVLGTK